MIITFVGDPHLRIRSPRGRKDKIWDTLISKLEWIKSRMISNNSDHLITTGDFLDSDNPSHLLVTQAIRLLKNDFAGIKVSTILGQHDIFGYQISTQDSCGIGPILESGYLDRIDKLSIDTVDIYGCHYGLDPKSFELKYDRFNILIIHDLIQEAPIYPGQVYVDASSFIEKSHFNFVVVGDYHLTYDITDKNNERIIAPGSLIRKTLNKRDLSNKPIIIFFNTETFDIWTEAIPVRPIDEVFNLDLIAKEQTITGMLSIFANKLKDTKTDNISWEDILKEFEGNPDFTEAVALIKRDLSEILIKNPKVILEMS